MRKRQITSLLLSIILAGSALYTPYGELPVKAAEIGDEQKDISEEKEIDGPATADAQEEESEEGTSAISAGETVESEDEAAATEDEPSATENEPSVTEDESSATENELSDPESEAAETENETETEEEDVITENESASADQPAAESEQEAKEAVPSADSAEHAVKGVLPVNTDGQEVIPGDNSGKSSDDLFADYVEKSFEGQNIPTASTMRKAKKSVSSRLTGIDRMIYDNISTYLPQIAAGERASTVFEFSVDDLGLEKTMWSAEELGVPSILALDEEGNVIVNDDGYAVLSQDALDAVYAKTDFDLSKILDALLADYPYHLYWFDKTQGTGSTGMQVGAAYDETIDEYVLGIVSGFSISFPVADEYAAGQYMVDTSIGQSVQTSVENANSIVEQYSDVSDYDKLCGYKDEISNLVSYNDEAAAGGVSYGNPWQMIWVFDGDPDTKVVCEGYAKAFKYLCDQSDFSGDINCITVSGVMEGGTGAGNHMWDIVNMEDGSNYLVDVTNCDEGTIGAPDQLFLVGTENGDIDSGYVFVTDGGDIEYRYSDTTRNTYSDDELTIESVSYGEEIPLVIVEQPRDVYADNLGDTVEVTVDASGKELTYQWYYKNAGASRFLASSQKTDTYSVTAAEKVKNRLVYCEIKDAYGNSIQTDTVGIYVNEPLQITQQPVDAYVEALGEKATVHVKASGIGIEYQWYYKNAGASRFLASSNKTSTYSVSVNERVQNRQVYCKIKDKNGNTVDSDIVGIYVDVQLQIVQQPEDAVVNAIGDKATVSVSATGTGLTYQWYYKNAGASRFLASSNKTPTYSLTVNDRVKDRKVYCRITDAHGNTLTTDEVGIYVSEPLAILEEPVDVSVSALGDKATVSVSATGTGLSYQWYYRNANASKFLASSNKTPVYSVTVNERVRNRQVYCVITDASGETLTTDTVIITVGE